LNEFKKPLNSVAYHTLKVSNQTKKLLQSPESIQTPACTVRAVMKTSKRVLLWRFSPNDHERIGGGDSFICNSISLWIRTVLTRSGWFLPQIWILLLKTREPQLKKKHTPRLSCTDSLIIALA